MAGKRRRGPSTPQDLDEAVHHARPVLTAGAQDAVHHAFLQAWATAPSGQKPHEPDHVAHLVTSGVRLLERAWSEALPHHDVSVAGVYCHGAPLVQVEAKPPPDPCELGDLLVCQHPRGRRRRTQGQRVAAPGEDGLRPGLGAGPAP